MKRIFGLILLVSGASMSHAQIPDLLNAFDAGSRSLGAGGSMGVTGADTLSAINNPAGLGYIRGRNLGLAYRNLPRSETRLQGNIADPIKDTQGFRGGSAITHLGYTMPFSAVKKGADGTLGFSYSLGGFVDDTRFGTGLQSPPFTVNNYVEQIKAKTEFFALSLGRTTSDQNTSWGYGLVFANQLVTNRATGTLSNNTPYANTNNSETGFGVGLVAGVQIIDKKRPNVSYGLSVRTPIDLGGNEATAAIYDRIPGLISGGVTFRRDGVGGGNDFIVYAAQLNYFFGGKSSPLLDRNTVATFGLGAEYNLVKGSGTFPIRLGYIGIPSGGDGFGDRSAFTLGFGYRPNNAPYSFDINYAFPRTGGNDLVFGLTYRFDN